MITWVLYLCIGVVIGGMAGFYFAKLDDFSKKQKLELEEKLQQSERELISYKDEVTSHFMKTADLINDMTESYQKVHEHLAHGSVELCNNAIEVNKLTVSTDQLLTTPSKSPSDDEAITSSADSEAPKSYTNNNNKENTSTSHAEVAESNDQESKSSTDSTVASAIASETSAATSSTQFPSDQPPVKQPSADNPATGHPVDMKENSQENDQTSESTTPPEPDAPTSPILETMAVAEEDESASEPEKKTKTKIPHNRIVH